MQTYCESKGKNFVKKQQVLTKEQQAFMAMPQDKVNAMIEQFLTERPPVVERKEEKRVRPLIGPLGAPRKHFTKTVTMVQTGESLKRANRGRPAKDEVRVTVTVPHNFIVMRPPVLYALNKSGDLIKINNNSQ
jgi:hypothetical protein